jgi:hypothetical protein
MTLMRSRHIAWLVAGTFAISLLMRAPVRAQDILGAITGTVKDSSGRVVADATVKARSINTNQEISQHTDSNGSYSALNLPIGMYDVTIVKAGFRTETHTQVLVSGNRTATVDATLQVATANTTVNVIETTPLMNQTDTTNGYVVDTLTIQNTPLGTGSFTQLAILAPGVHADLLGGSGSNSGLGNQAIFANGQRDTSNSFSLNGVDTNNLFNGNSTSQVGENRFVPNTGENFGAGNNLQTATSVFSAIGEALPTPPIEAIQEISVNAAMYDATQGAHSGAHIGVITKSGTNASLLRELDVRPSIPVIQHLVVQRRICREPWKSSGAAHSVQSARYCHRVESDKWPDRILRRCEPAEPRQRTRLDARIRRQRTAPRSLHRI